MKTGHESALLQENLTGIRPQEIISTADSNHPGQGFSETVQNNYMHIFDACMVDHSGKQYACRHVACEENCNLSENKFQADDQVFHALRFYPDDRKLWYESVWPDILLFMKNIDADEYRLYRFSFNHRYIQADGQVSQFLHEGVLSVSGESSKPRLQVKVFTEIGEIKTDQSIVLTIFRYAPDAGYRKVFNRTYGQGNPACLSQREMEIIKLCFQGLSSKMIASKLNLSIHTVKNHKRNCMEKTFTHNIAELINICIRSRWI